MELSTKIFIIILIIGIVIVYGTSLYFNVNNYSRAKDQKYKQFVSSFHPETGKWSEFTNSEGNNQISCSAEGGKVNIVGAIYNMFDPYNTCTNNKNDVNKIFSFQCDPSDRNGARCTSDEECPYYTGSSSDPFQCVNSRCQLKEISGNCPSGFGLEKVNIGGKFYCINSDVCGTNAKSYDPLKLPINSMCSPANTDSRCAVRDISAFVAKQCDGNTECYPDVNQLGDSPCAKIPPRECYYGYNKNGGVNWETDSMGRVRGGYCDLPYVPGWGGGEPYGIKDGKSESKNGNIGYTIHGIYTCVQE